MLRAVLVGMLREADGQFKGSPESTLSFIHGQPESRAWSHLQAFRGDVGLVAGVGLIYFPIPVASGDSDLGELLIDLEEDKAARVNGLRTWPRWSKGRPHRGIVVGNVGSPKWPYKGKAASSHTD